MNEYVLSAIAAVLFAGATALVLLPLARRIPALLELRWQQEVEEHIAHQHDEKSRIELPGYPPYAIVAIGAVLGFISLTAYGFNAEGAAACVFFFSLLLLLAINVKHALLPDMVVLPALWAALLFHSFTGHAAEHLYGAVAGYVAPFLLMFVTKLVTRAEVIGRGDMKALAMAGAWFGLAALPILLGAFLVSAIAYAILTKLTSRDPGLAPTGPAHLAASLVFLLYARGF
jgi:prepilin signal peptidase PulO-like enzyme (type II secretory pathway)